MRLSVVLSRAEEGREGASGRRGAQALADGMGWDGKGQVSRGQVPQRSVFVAVGDGMGVEKEEWCRCQSDESHSRSAGPGGQVRGGRGLKAAAACLCLIGRVWACLPSMEKTKNSSACANADPC